MSTETKCLEYACECERRAKLVTDPELRERLFNISRRWTERATREPSSSAEASGTVPILDAVAHNGADAVNLFLLLPVVRL
jgi:hypothetical protein